MDAKVRELKGCEPKDNFKRNHKDLPNRYYAIDYDLVLIEKVRGVGVPGAIIDYKSPTDRGLNWSHVSAYKYEKDINGKIVFIIEGDKLALPTADSPYKIFEFIDGNQRPNPPEFNLRKLGEVASMQEYQRFEDWARLQITIRSMQNEA